MPNNDVSTDTQATLDELFDYLTIIDDADFDYLSEHGEISPNDKIKIMNVFFDEYVENMHVLYDDFLKKMAGIRADVDKAKVQEILDKEKNNG